MAVSLNRIMSVHRLHETHKTAKPVKLASIRFLHLNPMEIRANKEGKPSSLKTFNELMTI